MSWFNKILSGKKEDSLDKGLEKSKTSFFDKLSKKIIGKSKVDDEILDDLEEVLISSDVGVETTVKIIERIEKRVAKDKYILTSELDKMLREEIGEMLAENNQDNFLSSLTEKSETKEPYVIMVVGVNGVGKTTTIGKLAYQFKKLEK